MSTNASIYRDNYCAFAGKPVPRRKLPPESLISYYTNPRKRGYLADDEALSKAEEELGQLMGYSRKCAVAGENKKPDQVFLGIPSGSIVSLVDRKIFLPTHPSHRKYYGLVRSSDDTLLSDTSYASTFSSHLRKKLI